MRLRDLTPRGRPGERIYAAVLKLRHGGRSVYAIEGRADLHELDGQIVPTSWLLDMAACQSDVVAGVVSP